MNARFIGMLDKQNYSFVLGQLRRIRHPLAIVPIILLLLISCSSEEANQIDASETGVIQPDLKKKPVEKQKSATEEPIPETMNESGYTVNLKFVSVEDCQCPAPIVTLKCSSKKDACEEKEKLLYTSEEGNTFECEPGQKYEIADAITINSREQRFENAIFECDKNQYAFIHSWKLQPRCDETTIEIEFNYLEQGNRKFPEDIGIEIKGNLLSQNGKTHFDLNLSKKEQVFDFCPHGYGKTTSSEIVPFSWKKDKYGRIKSKNKNDRADGKVLTYTVSAGLKGDETKLENATYYDEFQKPSFFLPQNTDGYVAVLQGLGVLEVDLENDLHIYENKKCSLLGGKTSGSGSRCDCPENKQRSAPISCPDCSYSFTRPNIHHWINVDFSGNIDACGLDWSVSKSASESRRVPFSPFAYQRYPLEKEGGRIVARVAYVKASNSVDYQHCSREHIDIEEPTICNKKAPVKLLFLEDKWSWYTLSTNSRGSSNLVDCFKGVVGVEPRRRLESKCPSAGVFAETNCGDWTLDCGERNGGIPLDRLGQALVYPYWCWPKGLCKTKPERIPECEMITIL